jgi:exosortase A-associated hydrolase 1
MNAAIDYKEQALSLACKDQQLIAIASVPVQASRRGVLIVVGGPQYRVGSHRQFALLARSLAAQGVPAMRFDYRGMGDSDGAARSFEDVNQDLKAAVDGFLAAVPGLSEVVIWGLCDAASAALFYAASDPRVCGLVLVNPWVRTTGGLAKATLKHYYIDRLLQPELWKKILSGRFNYKAAIGSFASLMRTAMGAGTAAATPVSAPGTTSPAGTSVASTLASADAAKAPSTANAPAVASAACGEPLPERMLRGLGDFKGKTLLILSGRDLTAQEFTDVTKGSRKWQTLLASKRVKRQALAEADHTFSRRVWRDQVATWTGEWVRSW